MTSASQGGAVSQAPLVQHTLNDRQWLPSRRSVLGVVHGVDAEEMTRAGERMASAYRAIPALAPASLALKYFPELRSGVCVVAPGDVTLDAGTPLVWGAPMSRSGPATHEEIRTALADPEAARKLSGIFVLVLASSTGIRMVTSATLVASLRRAGRAFATRATAAAILSGGSVEVAREAVAEAVIWQCSLRTGGELLAGVSPLDEATVVDIDIEGASPKIRSYWPATDRLHPGRMTTPESFRLLVGEAAMAASNVDEAMLGLTGGLDSTLAASCLADLGGQLSTFTIGHPGYPDLLAARAVANQLGWSHETAHVTDARGTPVRRRNAGKVPGDDLIGWLVAHAPWGDGFAHPRDAIVGHVRWRQADVLWVSGHGGEALRGSYGDPAGSGDLAQYLARLTAGWAPEPALMEFVDTLRQEIAWTSNVGREEDALDLIYLRRQFTWIDRSLPLTPVAHMHPLYMGAEVVRAVLDVPLEQRVSGEFIARAHELGAVDLRRVAAGASRGFPWFDGLRRGPWRPFMNDWPLLHELLRRLEADGFLARDVLGDRWWQWATESAAEQPWVRHCLWNAVAIESLHRWG